MQEPKRLKVLITEDDPASARVLMDQLRELPGLDLLLACDGQETLEAVRLFRPDVLLLDLILPDMTGFGVLQALRRVRPERRPRVIAISSAFNEATKDHVLTLGGEFLFPKPVPVDELALLLWAGRPATAVDLLYRISGEEQLSQTFYRIASALERLARDPRISLKEAYHDVMTDDCITYTCMDKAISRLIDRAEKRGCITYRLAFDERPTVSVFLRRIAGYLNVS